MIFFKFKVFIYYTMRLIRAGDTEGGWGEGHGTPTFLRSKKKKGKQWEKRKTFKAETIKRLSPRSKCYCFSHSRASRIQKFFWSAKHGGRQYLSVFHGPSALKSILPVLLIGNNTNRIRKLYLTSAIS